jgi:hypothetical protein
MDQFSNHPLYKRHTLDSVMSSFWEFYKKHFFILFLSSFVVSLGIQFLSSAIDISSIQSTTDPYEILSKMKVFLWPLISISVISIIFGVILNYYIVYNPVDDNINIFNSIYKSLKYLVPYLIILILFTFFAATAMLLGLLVFVIGIFFALLYVMTLYLFILPVLMAEEQNIGNSISRTFVLGHRNFWSNIGWVAVFAIIIIVFSLISSAIVLVPFSGSFLKVFTNPAEVTNMLNFTTNPVYIILSALVNALYLPAFSILGVILYFNGRAREEVVPDAVTASEPEKVRVEDLYAKPYSDDHPENPENK